MKKIIGITGSIGSGKTFATKMFEKICKLKNINASFIDVDNVRRNLLRQENIDRYLLNQKIYNDSKAMQEYKKYINPLIRRYIKEQIDKNTGIIFIEWALLIEDNLYDLVDSIVMIDCEEQIQIKRLENGDLGKEEIIKRIELQLSNKKKIEKLKEIKKEFFIIDTSRNPKQEEYENILRKEGLYE